LPSCADSRAVSDGSYPRQPGRRGIVIAALLALGIQLGSFWMVCVLSRNSIQENERQTAAVAARSAALRVELQKLTFGILSADVAASTYLLNGRIEALLPYRKANDAAPGIIGAIARLCEGHSDELDRIHRISALSDTAFDRLADLRQYDPDGKIKPPDGAVAAAHKAVQALITAVAAFQETESRDLAQSLKSIGHSTTVSQQNVTDLGGALAIGGGVLSTIILVGVILKRERRLAANAFVEEPIEPEVEFEAHTYAPNSYNVVSLASQRATEPSAPTTREVVEMAVEEIQETAAARRISFRAEIGPAWDFAVGANPASLQQIIAHIFEAIMNACAPGGPVTLTCVEQPGRMVRLQFHSYSKLLAKQLPESLLNSALSLPGSSIRGSEPGVVCLDFPCVPSITDLAALQQAAQSTMGVASPA